MAEKLPHPCWKLGTGRAQEIQEGRYIPTHHWHIFRCPNHLHVVLNLYIRTVDFWLAVGSYHRSIQLRTMPLFYLVITRMRIIIIIKDFPTNGGVCPCVVHVCCYLLGRRRPYREQQHTDRQTVGGVMPVMSQWLSGGSALMNENTTSPVSSTSDPIRCWLAHGEREGRQRWWRLVGRV